MGYFYLSKNDHAAAGRWCVDLRFGFSYLFIKSDPKASEKASTRIVWLKLQDVGDEGGDRMNELNHLKTLGGSLSAVSKPIFASKILVLIRKLSPRFRQHAPLY